MSTYVLRMSYDTCTIFYALGPSIPSRLSSTETKERITAVNAGLLSLCRDKGEKGITTNTSCIPWKTLVSGVLDILCIQESKLDDSFPKSQFDVPGQDYKCKEGGIMVFVRDDIPHKRCMDLEVNVDTCLL